MLHQAYGYFRTYGADALWLKVLVSTDLGLRAARCVLGGGGAPRGCCADLDLRAVIGAALDIRSSLRCE